MTTTAEKPRTEIPPFKNEVVKDFKDKLHIIQQGGDENGRNLFFEFLPHGEKR